MSQPTIGGAPAWWRLLSSLFCTASPRAATRHRSKNVETSAESDLSATANKRNSQAIGEAGEAHMEPDEEGELNKKQMRTCQSPLAERGHSNQSISAPVRVLVWSSQLRWSSFADTWLAVAWCESQAAPASDSTVAVLWPWHQLLDFYSLLLTPEEDSCCHVIHCGTWQILLYSLSLSLVQERIGCGSSSTWGSMSTTPQHHASNSPQWDM